MITAPTLRSTNPQDPRPTHVDRDVQVLAISTALPAILDWARLHQPGFDEAHAEHALIIALELGGADAFRMGVVLGTKFNWPVDYTLVRAMSAVVEALPTAYRAVTGRWVARTGIRFPAKEGDTIEFFSAAGKRLVGKVVGVSALTATAYVQPSNGTEFTNPPIEIAAEAVVANVTQNRFTPETPILGATYVDAPALGRAAEAARAKMTAGAASPKTPPPFPHLTDFRPDPDGPAIA
ncbi:hypothetical protein HOT99_gp101 [Caulobacter phage CcrBL10]|uniref:Uncharacterized protein n=1 Tax=Caulobacter phage CcrBL10 TaxID=2283269 RepID=A0A385E9V6_9CAUD|nr:hypothetical protein HOT99_gp101 [Caulobacter phage CcrBL10]AXQ68516.1 hypothetical protein CcrBL10_gp312 [Caulobacter phage CcrBL10]